MLNFNEEIILKAKQAKSLEDLLQLAKGNNLELTDEMAKEYFDKLNQESGELKDEELEIVNGGDGSCSNDYLFDTCPECGICNIGSGTVECHCVCGHVWHDFSRA